MTCTLLRRIAIGVTMSGTRSSHVRTNPTRHGSGSMKSLTIRPRGRSWAMSGGGTSSCWNLGLTRPLLLASPTTCKRQISCTLELRDYFHAFATEANRSEMGYLHMLHISDIVSCQANQAQMKRRAWPLWRIVLRGWKLCQVPSSSCSGSQKRRSNKPTPSMSPWAALDENEYEGPSVGRAKVHLLLSNRNWLHHRPP